MLRVFAKHGTSEKCLVVCPRENVRNVQHLLSQNYGGEWLLVDEIDPRKEVLKFDDGLKYLGFYGKPERYSSAIEELTIKY